MFVLDVLAPSGVHISRLDFTDSASVIAFIQTMQPWLNDFVLQLFPMPPEGEVIRDYAPAEMN